MYNVLLVDDEPLMLELLTLYLEPQGYFCKCCGSGEEAIQALKSNEFDVVLLDIMMPGKDGWTTCEAMREFSSVPIIMLTARDQKSDIVKGLRLGADDYITKPFDEEELLARIDAVTRRTAAKKSANGLQYNEAEHTVSYQGEKISLTPKEFLILGLFLNNPSRVFSRDQMIVSIWGYSATMEDRTIDSHVKNMREKLRAASFPIDDYLHTVWGVGYKWEKSS